MMTYLPLFLKADTKTPILVIGGGAIACAKTEALASVNAKVEVIAKTLSEELVILCGKHGFSYREEEYAPGMLDDRQVVVAATDDNGVNARIAADCRARRVLVNVVDNPALCDFIFPALVRRGPLQIAISSSGISPVLARLIKQTIETLIPARFEQVIGFLQTKKVAMRQQLSKLQPRRMFYEQIIRGHVAEDILEGNMERAHASFDKALNEYPNEGNAALYLIGAGPGNPDLVTIKAVRILGQADVILYDRLIPQGLMDNYARKDAHKIAVGKTRHHHHKKQDEIDEIIAHHLRKNRIVVRLKGGDPGIYAHGAEEIAVARKMGVPYQIVPGISAANGCAAYAGIPLTERGGASSVRFLSIYKDQLGDEAFWEGLRHAKGETLALYMSSNNYVLLCHKLIELGFDATTPLLVVEQGTTTHHKDYPATLETFEGLYAEHKFASPCLMIIGNVVRWHEQHAWKEAPETSGNYFTDLPVKEVAYV
ncbi:MAG: uroporphyrinogen-III C-methyltransferase [Alphaproteobacteria bacterium]|nr:MAG: uroporphyrinogen-III C-methyltransferase [Alphaproteobacteria bacterium]